MLPCLRRLGAGGRNRRGNDSLVYDLYGLTAGERKIIEESTAKA
ncbi:MAG TPA: hypothetical protein VF982_11805 [Anaerolineales bacterium]